MSTPPALAYWSVNGQNLALPSPFSQNAKPNTDDGVILTSWIVNYIRCHGIGQIAKNLLRENRDLTRPIAILKKNINFCEVAVN